MPIALLLAAAAAGAAFTEKLDRDALAYTQPVIAITGAQVIDGTGAPPRRDMTLVIRDGRIAALGPSASTRPPAGAEVIDGRGKTLIPGFVMVHEHLFYPSSKGAQYGEFPYSMSRLYLAGGTTTMRTGGSLAPLADVNTRALIDAGKAAGPDIDASGPYLEGRGAYTVKMQVLKDPADAARTVDYWAQEGVTSFKAYMNIPRAELKAAIDAAHRRGMKVTGHLCSVTYREAAGLGIDDLEHGFMASTDFVRDKAPDVCPVGAKADASLLALDPEGAEATALLKLLVDRKVAVTSTLNVFETTAAGQPSPPDYALQLLAPQLRESFQTIQARVRSRTAVAADERKLLLLNMRLEKRFLEMGGLLITGTDPTGIGGVVPGHSAKRNLELLVQEGHAVPAAVRIATLNGALYLGRDKDVGSLAVGKRADVVVVDGDLAADAMAIERMPLVFKAGVGYRTQVFLDGLKGAIGLY